MHPVLLIVHEGMALEAYGSTEELTKSCARHVVATCHAETHPQSLFCVRVYQSQHAFVAVLLAGFGGS